MGDAWVEVGRVKWEEQLGVVCIKVMVEGKGGDESAEGGSVHDEKQRTKNGALGDATGASIEGWESVRNTAQMLVLDMRAGIFCFEKEHCTLKKSIAITSRTII